VLHSAHKKELNKIVRYVNLFIPFFDMNKMSLHTLSFDVGTKNLAFCDLTVHANGSFDVHAWQVLSCVPRGMNVNKTSIHELAPMFYQFIKKLVRSWFFNEDGSSKGIQRVFIENQPLGGRGAARNLKTKVLSHMLQVVCLDVAPDVPVSFIHPSLKLKDMPKNAEDKKSTYRENKMYAIATTARLVESNQCLTKDLCKSAFTEKKIKKDDLADSFLQGLFAGGAYARGEVLASPTDERPKKKAKESETAVGEKRKLDGMPSDRPTKKVKKTTKTAISEEAVLVS